MTKKFFTLKTLNPVLNILIKYLNKFCNLVTINPKGLNLKNSITVNTIYNSIDYFILVIVIFALLGDFIYIISSFISHLFDFFNINSYNLICYIGDDNTTIQASTNTVSINTTPQSSTNVSSTTTTIIHDDGSWSNTVRSIFIYGTGAFRLSLLRGGGSAGSRAFVIASTLATDTALKVLNNTINDTSYVKSHYLNWKAAWLDASAGSVRVDIDTDTTNNLLNESATKFVGDGSNLGNLIQSNLTGIFKSLKFILEPVQVNYSNEILANQIYDVSILLFIISVLITGLIAVLLFNIFIYINMDKIINFFNNKYIRWYLVLNKKMMGVEIFLLGGTILYFMYSLSVGIRFIATHPIIIN